MWQRFTERARIAVYQAQKAAQEAGTLHVAPEHLLLGVLADAENTAVRVLIALGVEAGRLEKEVERSIERSEPIESAEMTLTPEAKRTINFAYEEARELTNEYIGTEHLLVALIRPENGVAGRACATLGIQLENARLAVVTMQKPDGNPRSIDAKPPSESKSSVWDRFDEPARRAISAANEEAKRLGQSMISPDHFLTGLLAEPESAAVRALHRLDIDIDALRLATIRLGRSDGPPRTLSVGYSPASNAAFLLAYEERRALRMPKVGPDHLLIGLLREPDGVAGRLLSQYGVQLDALREAILSSDTEPV